MAFLGFGKKKEIIQVNVKDYLSDDEIGMLITELNTLAKRVPGETSAVVSDLAKTIREGGTIPAKEGLGMCVSAIKMNQSFSESQEGSSALLDKLSGVSKTLLGK